MKKILLLLAVAIAGCSKAPDCGSDIAQDLVLQIVEPKLISYYHHEHFMAILRKEVIPTTGDAFTDEEFDGQVNILFVEKKPRLEMIITNELDDKAMSSTCSAHITDISNADILNVQYQLNISSDNQLVARVHTNQD